MMLLFGGGLHHLLPYHSLAETVRWKCSIENQVLVFGGVWLQLQAGLANI